MEAGSGRLSRSSSIAPVREHEHRALGYQVLPDAAWRAIWTDWALANGNHSYCPSSAKLRSQSTNSAISSQPAGATVQYESVRSAQVPAIESSGDSTAAPY